MPAQKRLHDGAGADHGSGSGRKGLACARSRVNETKATIIAVMREIDRPVASKELHSIWSEDKPLATFEYHLSTLVMAGVAELVIGPELYFRLSEAVEGSVTQRLFRERCR